MNTTISPNSNEPIDQLLSNFMKSEMPNPWPNAPRVSSNSVAPSSLRNEKRRMLTSSHMSLAASVALIVGGCWFLSGIFSQDNVARPAAGSLEGGKASTKNLHDLIKKSGNSTNPMR